MPALLQEQMAPRDQLLGNAPTTEADDAHAHDVEDELPEAYCGGCGRLIDEESVEEGVIQFATKLWHVECFRCAKCKNRVSTERDDILLLSDGHPICGECNYSCNICNLPIMEEAIMTGDESYHASCFTCRSCHSKIEELVFAKTSQGIYCMKCHNERVARSRKHAEQKRAKARREKQLQDAQSAELNLRNNLTSPNTSAATPSPSSDQPPPSLPSKELPSPTPSVLASPAPNSANLSPYINQGGTAATRPGSAGGKRPMNAPPPPSREGRSPAMAAHAKLEARAAMAPSNSHSDSRTSLSSVTADEQLQPHGRDYEVTAPLSPRRKAFASGLDSPQGSPAANKIRLPGADGADSSASPTASPPLKKGLPLGGSPRSDGERKLRPSTSREGLGVNLRASSSKPATSARNPLNASGSSSRLSKVYSFYDPDFLNLVESFGDFGSTDELHSHAPPVPALPSSIPTASAASESTSTKSAAASAPATAHSNAAGSSASELASTAPPSKSASESENLDGETTALHGRVTSGVAGSADSEEEVLNDDRRNTVTSTGSLKEVSSKVRASMQQARDGQVSMDISFVETILQDLEQTRQRMESLQMRYDRIRRASQQAAHGFTMAKEEFEHEVNARHEAEMEMARLRRQLAEQALKLAAANSEKRQQEQLERRSHDVKASLKGMERDLAKLTVERDLTVAEVAELVALQDGTAGSSPSALASANGARTSTSTVDAAITQNLASRLEAVKSRYRKEIDELTTERDSLLIEIEELKQSKELFLEEAQSLNAKNEELNTMLGQLNRKIELAAQSRDELPPLPPLSKDLSSNSAKSSGGFSFGSRHKHVQRHTPRNASISSHDAPPSSAGYDSISVDTVVQQVIKPSRVEPAPAVKKFKWMKPKLSETSKANVNAVQNGAVPPVPPKGPALGGGGAAMAALTRATSHDVVVREHLFQPFNVLRPTRCFACQKNMWGQSEMRCALCTQVCHSRCLQSLPVSCNQPYTRPEEGQAEKMGPSMFGRLLTEQAAHEGRDVPLIVEKCIQAVEAFGMDYEGIYRKSGGTSQLKVITQLFERGNAFDLEDTNRFNDVSAITSVLKNYFRELPTPLLTYELYDELIKVVESKQEDVTGKLELVKGLVERLPRQHYCTLQQLVGHLYRVQERSGDNRMNARNLGVVFGPTLMRSADPTQEFAHMGGKAMTIEFFIDHAPELFA